MPKKDKKPAKRGEAAAASAPPADSSEWTCAECGQENEPADELCCACEEPKPSLTGDDPFEGYVTGKILEVTPVPKKDKLSVLQVDIGEEEILKIVTNAPNVREGMIVAVAKVGAKVRGDSGEEEVVQKGSVGGVASFGMLCNGVMLGWKGGDSKAAATLPEDFPLGARPPESRPRKDF
mmetsp:Transcript_28649/g.80679  ORF Transcript_28649/g.80679 Transcript_28649/m.80679 type:complete len:179 (+) Transcript_28649:84-620(+)|eukprot:CAMPEP_0117670004 /NCGR_PEP_ID=MMETSP0804-20121206/12475_1 /TAXON_ID=1074897 /ORGANISM="Tetraselmis astigmatica, Strain CCMP880" /LENGTH=178 /DNA_ID=CAMNT_0005478181 /DNA_START=23 /DNA_END=559 /DNA_ORIENTATION=+